MQSNHNTSGMLSGKFEKKFSRDAGKRLHVDFGDHSATCSQKQLSTVYAEKSSINEDNNSDDDDDEFSLTNVARQRNEEWSSVKQCKLRTPEENLKKTQKVVFDT